METLIKEVKHYEVETSKEANDLIKESVDSSGGDVSYARKYKNKKSKGEIVAEWYEVKIEVSFPDRKMTNNL